MWKLQQFISHKIPLQTPFPLKYAQFRKNSICNWMYRIRINLHLVYLRKYSAMAYRWKKKKNRKVNEETHIYPEYTPMLCKTQFILFSSIYSCNLFSSFSIATRISSAQVFAIHRKSFSIEAAAAAACWKHNLPTCIKHLYISPEPCHIWL